MEPHLQINFDFIWDVQSPTALSLDVSPSDLEEAAALFDLLEEAVINVLDNLPLLDFLQLLVDFLFQGQALLLAHLFLDFSNVLFGASSSLLTILPQLAAVCCPDVFNEGGAISDAGTFKGVDDGAASLVETVRSAYLKANSFE